MSTQFRIPARLAVLALVASGISLAMSTAPAQAAGTTYYVSPSGSDSNNGTSPSSAIRTLSRASGLQLKPGDQLLLERGATHSGKLAIWRSGTQDNPITISAYGSGSRPVVTGECLEVGASYITMTNLVLSNCAVRGIWTNGTGNVITEIEATGNIHGIEVGEQARNTKVLNNYLHHNQRMAANTPGAFDDYGAVGVVVSGYNTEVAYNVITDNWAPSADFGTDGSAVEIYGGVDTLVHHNSASNNRTFTELGNSRSANTTYAYNEVVSDLRESEFLITRGPEDYFGPVRGTVAMNNTVQLTGAKSLGISCYAGCRPELLTLTNNVLDVAGRIGWLQGSVGGGNNIYWRGSLDGYKMLEGDQFVDPQFKDGTLKPKPKSPLVDSGNPTPTQDPTPLQKDLQGNKVGVDGNGDGKAGPDIGAYEAKPKGKKGAKGKRGKKKRAKHKYKPGTSYWQPGIYSTSPTRYRYSPIASTWLY